MTEPIRTPTAGELSTLREDGIAFGYVGASIYERYRAIYQLLGGVDPSRILVAGCGYAVFDRLLPASAKLIGVDPGKAEIEVASAWAAQHRPNSRYIEGTLQTVEIPESWADLSIASEVIEHLPEDQVPLFMDQLIRNTRQGGDVVLTVPNIQQLRNRARRIVGLPPALMDRTHLREYTLSAITEIVKDYPLRVVACTGAVIYAPFENVLQRFLDTGSPIRRKLAERFPTIASHILIRAQRI